MKLVKAFLVGATMMSVVAAASLPTAIAQGRASTFTAYVTGTVTSVDQSSGRMTLRGPDGDVNVRFPAPAIQSVKVGDTVTVGFGLMEQGSPAASPGMRGPSGPTTPGASGGSSSGSSSYGSSTSGGSSYGGSSSGGTSSGGTR